MKISKVVVIYCPSIRAGKFGPGQINCDNEITTFFFVKLTYMDDPWRNPN